MPRGALSQPSPSPRLDPDVEMQHFFANPKFLIKGDCWIVAIIGLNIDDPSAASRGNFPQMLNESGCDALPSMLSAYGKVIDV